jgi:hypothetical protein
MHSLMATILQAHGLTSSGTGIVSGPTGTGGAGGEPANLPASGAGSSPCWACDEERKRSVFLDEHIHACWLKEVA